MRSSSLQKSFIPTLTLPSLLEKAVAGTAFIVYSQCYSTVQRQLYKSTRGTRERLAGYARDTRGLVKLPLDGTVYTVVLHITLISHTVQWENLGSINSFRSVLGIVGGLVCVRLVRSGAPWGFVRVSLVCSGTCALGVIFFALVHDYRLHHAYYW